MENGNVEAMVWVRVATLNVTTEISSDRVLFVQTAISLQLLVIKKFKGVSKFDYMKWPLMKQADNTSSYIQMDGVHRHPGFQGPLHIARGRRIRILYE